MIHEHRVLALAAQSAQHFAVRRRSAKRRDGWRPMTLFWRQIRIRPQTVCASQRALTTGAVNLAQVHLHFVVRAGDNAPRTSAHELSPGTVSHQKRVAMEHQRTIIQSRMYWVHLHRTKATLRASLPRRLESHSSTRPQPTTHYSSPALQPITAATTNWGAVRAPSRNLGQTRLRVHPSKSVVGNDQSFQSVQRFAIEPRLYRSQSPVMHHSAPYSLQESTGGPFYIQPQQMVWRRAMQPAADNSSDRQPREFDALNEPSHGRSFTGTESAFGASHSSRHAPATQVIKIDSVLIDRMADDVIRRLERRARIERARQGL